MTEDADNATPMGAADSGAGVSAGAMLRSAREKRGLHIAVLAAAIKVAPRKLEALEADRYDELPDLTFTRALAQTVCRSLKIDAEPVLGKLPPAGDMPKLAQVGGGINAPFHEAPGHRDPGEFTLLRKPAFWATLVVLAGALARCDDAIAGFRGGAVGDPCSRGGRGRARIGGSFGARRGGCDLGATGCTERTNAA
jgi:transcriptional regulator with XRE-family HTH domain